MGDRNHPPVLLVHGIFNKSGVFGRLKAYLGDRGRSVHTLDLDLRWGTTCLEAMAKQVADYADRTFPPDCPIDLVGLSMGGLVSRYYVQRLGGIQRVRRFITIAAPHRGTWMAYLLPVRVCEQMRPHSPFLQDLNRDAAALQRISFTSIWTPWDFIIVPPESSCLSVGREVQVNVIAHARMVRHPASMGEVAKALEG